MNPVVTIIVPVFNAEKTIEKCIKSIINQTLKEIEIVIIDDCSTDNTKTLLEQYKNESKIKIIKNNKNEGPSISRNKGINIAKGKYIGFVDSDDYIEPTMFEYMLNKITKEVDLVCCGRRNIYKTGTKIILPKKITNNPKKFSSTSNYTCDKLFKKSIINKYNIQFPEKYRYAEDFAFLIKYKYYANKMNVVKEPLYNYVINKNSITKTYNASLLDIIEVLNDTLLFFKNNESFEIYEKELLKISRGYYIRRLKEFKNFKNFKLKKTFALKFRQYFKKNFKDYKKYDINFSKNSNRLFKSSYVCLVIYILYSEVLGGIKK